MRFINKVAIAVLLVTLAGTAAFGKSHKKQVDFNKAVSVNGILVKAGSYYVAFDDAANELSIIKNGKVVAKAAAHLEQRTSKARDTQLRQRAAGAVTELIGITFSGSDQNVVIGQMGMQAGGIN